MVVIGFALAFSSTFLVKPVQERVSKTTIVLASLIVMVVCGLAFILIENGVLIYLPPFFFYFFFGVSYPTLLGLFSSAVGEEDQGWVMGVTTAVCCLAGGVMSLVSGGLTSIDIRMPYFIVIVTAAVGVVALLATWRSEKMKSLLK